jgi:membrane fusion protein (multidrug efflux system)
METNTINKRYNNSTIMIKNTLMTALLSIMLVACGGSKDPKAELDKLKKEREALEAKITLLEEEVAKTDTTGSDKVTEVVGMPVTTSTFKSYIEVQGRVDADESVSITTELPGTITKINVKVGDRVSKGQVLAETDVRAQSQQLAALQASMSLVNQMYEKQKNLWNEKIGTEIQFLQMKTAKEGLEASVNAVQEQIKMSKIISPIEGTVDLVNLKVGQAVSPGMGVINVVNFSNLKVKADVAESYASRVKNNNDVLVLFPDMNDSVIGKIHYASRAINAMTRTFAVEMLLDGKKEYHPNTVAKLKINDYQSPEPVIVLPVKYIQKGTETSYVLVAENGKAVRKVVKTGHEYAGLAEISEGLKVGDVIITLGYDLVNEGDNVIVAKQ